jgi:hypothetical protein
MATDITVTDYTDGTIGGAGVFDKMMAAVEAHIAQEHNTGRIRGSEYATVYLGALQSTQSIALQFILGEQQAQAETALLESQKLKVDEELNLVTSQIALTDAQELKVDAEKLLVDQQTANAVTENTVLVAQECKLRAEYDLILEQVNKVTAETGVLNQKKVTEQAQTNGSGVTTDSVVGAQVQLYQRQADGFLRDAEQKAAKLLIDTWNVRRTTDEATVADTTNKLDDASIGSVVAVLKTGIGA